MKSVKVMQQDIQTLADIAASESEHELNSRFSRHWDDIMRDLVQILRSLERLERRMERE